MLKTIHFKFALACLMSFSTSWAQQSLSDLKGLEGSVGASNKGSNSPSQVVILNNTPNTLQSQDQETSLEQRTQSDVRQGWGTGDSLEDLRRRRNNKEAQNEQTLMEKLEESRMYDEKSRLRRLFKIRQYNRQRHQELGEEGLESFGEVEEEMEIEYDQPVQHKKPVVKVIVPDSFPVENSAPVAYQTSKKTSSLWGPQGDFFVKGQLGVGEYKAADNSQGESSWGLSIGKKLNPKMELELGLFRTAYEINDFYAVRDAYRYAGISNFRDLTQYNLTGFLAYKLINQQNLSGLVRLGLSYVRRDSESSDLKGLDSFRSNTIDGAVGVGLDVKVSQNISVTGSFDYYSNLINDIASTGTNTVERVETADYYVFGIGLKLEL